MQSVELQMQDYLEDRALQLHWSPVLETGPDLRWVCKGLVEFNQVLHALYFGSFGWQLRVWKIELKLRPVQGFWVNHSCWPVVGFNTQDSVLC